MRIAIVGAGGLGRVVAETLAQHDDHELAGFIDNRLDAALPTGSPPILGPADALAEVARTHGVAGIVVAIGNPLVRIRLADVAAAAGLSLPAIVDRDARVSASAEVADGVYVAGGAIIGPGVRVARLAIINTAAVVEHDAVLEAACYVGPRCLIDARATVAAHAIVSGGTVVGQDVRFE